MLERPWSSLDVLGSADLHGGLRAAVTGIQVCAILRMVVRHTVPAVRPDDVLTALRDGQRPRPVCAACNHPAGAGFASPPGRGDRVMGAAVTQGSRDVKTENQAQCCRSRANAARDRGRRCGSACAFADNVLPRGARAHRGTPPSGGAPRTRAPGSLTGDCPNARQRAERQRIR